MVDVAVSRELLYPWAKSVKKTHSVHLLLCHLVDTMEVAYRLYPVILGPQVRKELEQSFRPLGGSPKAWVALLCGLHDLGKYTPAFQALVLDVALELFPKEYHPALDRCAGDRKLGVDTKHGLATAVHMKGVLRGAGASVDTARLIANVLGGHHGYFPVPGELKDVAARNDLGEEKWNEARTAMVRAIAKVARLTMDNPGWPRVEVSALGMTGLAGLTTISDWVASDARFFPYQDHCEHLADYRDCARKRAAKALADTNWSLFLPREVTRYQDLFAGGPRPVQRAVADALEGATKPGVLVIEAPTGEGKTKAGLYAAASLVHRLGLGGVYFATPTKELSRQAIDDVEEMLKATGSPIGVNRVYSGAAQEAKDRKQQDKDREQQPKEPSINPTGVGQEDNDGNRDPSDWFRYKKGLAFPVGVGTVDQAVKSVIRSKHAFLAMASLSNKVLLIDEVHAYDAYTQTLIHQLMYACGEMNIPVVLMSATLPGDSREALIEHWRAGAEGRTVRSEHAQAAAPGAWGVRWTWASEERPASEPPAYKVSDERGKIRVEHVDESPAAIAAMAVDQVGERGTALVVLNTKWRAEAVRNEIEALLGGRSNRPEVVFFTGDHQGTERQKIQERLKALMGKKSPPERHAIVVGTQVLEHGLDIDADFMISDLCPIDLLFQRAGRLHRFDRKGCRPEGLEVPVLAVADLSPEARKAKKRSGTLGFTAWISNVYAPWILGRSRAIVRKIQEQGYWRPLYEIGEQIHRVYVSEESFVEEGWERAWQTAGDSYRLHLDECGALARSVMTSRSREADAVLSLTRRAGPASRTRYPTGAPEKRDWRSGR